MFLDAMLRFSNKQVVTADARSTDTLDLTAIGGVKTFVGQPFVILILIDTAADFTTGDETYSFQLRTDDNTSFSSPTTLYTQAILASSLTGNAKVIIPAPVQASVEQYLELYYDVGGTTPSMTVTAFLCPAAYVDMFDMYKDAITVG